MACCTVLAVDKVQAADKVRTWTDVQGRTMEAEFLREVDGDVAFLKDGKLITVPLERLSEADQKTIRELEANKVVPAEEKPAGALPAFVDPTVRPEKALGDLGTNGSKGDSAETRVWTDIRGNKFTGKFVRVHEGFVVLLRGERTMTLAFYTLSAADQTYVRELLTARGEANLIPPPVSDNQNAEPGRGAPGFNQPPQVARGTGADGEPPTDDLSHGRADVQRGEANRQVEEPSPTVAPSLPPADGQAQTGASRSESRRRRLRFENAQDIIKYVTGLPIAAAVGSLIFAFIVRAAVYWVSGEHLPYSDAYVTAFLLYISYGLVGLAFGVLTMGVPDQTVDLLMIPMAAVAFFVQAAVISTRLNASFGAACLVTFLIYLTVAAIIAILVLLILAVVFGVGIAVSLRH